MNHGELREARALLGLTQEQMAARLKTPRRTYQDWEEGRVGRIPGAVEVAVAGVLRGLSGPLRPGRRRARGPGRAG